MLKTLSCVPDMEGLRYSPGAMLGPDKCSLVRMEHASLAAYVALALGCTPDELTIPLIEKATAALASSLAAASKDGLA